MNSGQKHDISERSIDPYIMKSIFSIYYENDFRPQIFLHNRVYYFILIILEKKAKENDYF